MGSRQEDAWLKPGLSLRGQIKGRGITLERWLNDEKDQSFISNRQRHTLEDKNINHGQESDVDWHVLGGRQCGHRSL